LQKISHRLLEIRQPTADGASSPSAKLCERLKVAGRSLLVTLVAGLVAVLPAAAQTMKERLSACLGCHGENGRSQNPDIPSLGAQQAFYVTVQLVMFREGLRVFAPMNDATKGLSDDDVRSIADFIAKLPAPPPPASPVDQDRIARARALVQQNHCDICHAPNFAGQQNVPRIADQREDYLIKALRGYKDSSRHGYDATMAETMASVSDDQILDLAYYIAEVR
jgi:cytochrome c553